MSTPGGAGTPYDSRGTTTLSVLGSPVSLIRIGALWSIRLRPFALPHPDNPCSYQDALGRGILRGLPAFIMLALLAALFLTTSVLTQRGLHFALLCVAQDLGWCDHDYRRWGEHT